MTAPAGRRRQPERAASVPRPGSVPSPCRRPRQGRRRARSWSLSGLRPSRPLVLLSPSGLRPSTPLVLLSPSGLRPSAPLRPSGGGLCTGVEGEPDAILNPQELVTIAGAAQLRQLGFAESLIGLAQVVGTGNVFDGPAAVPGDDGGGNL